jgi:RNA polymerase sigma-70 factor, ECF subfamily
VNEDDDGTLVRRCRDGDRAAFEQLVIRYQKAVYNAALRLLRDAEEARDVAQTTFLKVFEHLADYDPSFKFYSWIYRIAVNESLNILGRRRPYEQISGEEADEAPGPDRLIEGQEARRAIEDALMRINPELRTVIVLRHFMHLSYQDMGDILVLPEKTVKSRLYSARQLLRDSLIQHGAT